MGTLRTVLFVIFVLDSVLLVIAVLLQSGRGGGLAGALGGIGSADSALGVRAASQIEKATGILATIFLATALALAFVPRLEEKTSDVKVTDRPTMGAATSEPATTTSEPAATTSGPAAATSEPARKTSPAEE